MLKYITLFYVRQPCCHHVNKNNLRFKSVFNVMSILLVILVRLIANLSNNLHNYVTENVFVSINLLSTTYVLILEDSIINRYAERTDPF